MWLVLTWVLPARAPLATALAALGRPRRPPPQDEASLEARVGAWVQRAPAVRRRLAPLRADLAITQKTTDELAAVVLVATVVGALWAPTAAALLALAGVSVPVVIPAWLALAGAALGAWAPVRSLRADAARLRQGFGHALGVFCDVASMSLAAGSQVEGALQTAVGAGQGPAFDELRDALATGYLAGLTPWDALGARADELELADLAELAGALALAGNDGATVRATIAAKARSIRERLAADIEREAASVTERMGIPATVLLFGFAGFLGFPAFYVLVAGG